MDYSRDLPQPSADIPRLDRLVVVQPLVPDGRFSLIGPRVDDVGFRRDILVAHEEQAVDCPTAFHDEGVQRTATRAWFFPIRRRTWLVQPRLAAIQAQAHGMKCSRLVLNPF